MIKESNYLLKKGFSISVIQDLLMEGYTLPEIAKKVNIDYQCLVSKYKPIKKNFKYFENIQTPDEVDDGVSACSFTFDGVYTWDRLSESEIKAYNNYNQKHKAYYEL